MVCLLLWCVSTQTVTKAAKTAKRANDVIWRRLKMDIGLTTANIRYILQTHHRPALGLQPSVCTDLLGEKNKFAQWIDWLSSGFLKSVLCFILSASTRARSNQCLPITQMRPMEIQWVLQSLMWWIAGRLLLSSLMTVRSRIIGSSTRSVDKPLIQIRDICTY